MLSALAFLCFVVTPTVAVAAALVRWLESAAAKADEEDRMQVLTSNAADIAMRIENLETVMRAERGQAASELMR
ncbi:hypothetical protein ACIKTA_10975 [Hansschlegelia beijingensis]|uniref:hypothetical protein n=1 Tax=Hansschlegelia beijingensis TaxID=1133344 RepID=UPI0038304031